MKEIRNKTGRPIRVPLPLGKTLHLGPAQTAQLADNAVEHPGIKKLLADGAIEILGEGEKSIGGRSSASARERTHGAAKSIRRGGAGDR